MNVPLWVLVLVGAATDFIIVFTATLTGAMTATLAVAQTTAMPSKAAWLLAVLFGLGAAAKELRSQLKLGPTANGK